MTADVALGILALLAGALWRLEVEWRGWEGLRWAGYFHFAVPIGVASFLVWTWLFLDVPSRRRRAAIIAVLALFAAIAVPLTEASLRTVFSRFSFVHPLPWPVLFWWLLSPSLVVGVLRAFRVSVESRRWVLGQALFVAAWPLATLVTQVIPQHGYSDAMHAFKSGLVVPFFVVALGLSVPTRNLGKS
ncbi:MAG TPA: hypothetical protein VM694_44690 [Polyangium sp.]|nr:hypothetical protein [Polyangium sp.]